MGTVERLVRYAQVHTDSKLRTGNRPSTPWQMDLSQMLRDEMDTMGVSRARMDEMGYVYGEIPASTGCEDAPAIGFIAHIDTAPDFTGEKVHPRIIENYNGEDVELGAGRTLSVDKYPHLKNMKGDTLVVTDGTTLLGADDKAGVAVIMTFLEKLLASDMPHGKVCVCFNPDEEIGEGAWDLNVDELGADYAYTIDGAAAGDLIYECFNASAAYIKIKGYAVHPGASKDRMINAVYLATQIAGMLPQNQSPRDTEGYEGYFHLSTLTGGIAQAEMRITIRDFNKQKFLAREQYIRNIVDMMDMKYGEGTVTLDLQEQYGNMADEIQKHFHMIEIAEAAIRDAGLQPKVLPIRGGTDGAQLTMKKGLPCPDLGEGAFAMHGPYEHASGKQMDQTVEILMNIIRRYAEPGAAPRRIK